VPFAAEMAVKKLGSVTVKLEQPESRLVATIRDAMISASVEA
jgi:hypothetical protein